MIVDYPLPKFRVVLTDASEHGKLIRPFSCSRKALSGLRPVPLVAMEILVGFPCKPTPILSVWIGSSVVLVTQLRNYYMIVALIYHVQHIVHYLQEIKIFVSLTIIVCNLAN